MQLPVRPTVETIMTMTLLPETTLTRLAEGGGLLDACFRRRHLLMDLDPHRNYHVRLPPL